MCQERREAEIVEVKIGYDGIADRSVEGGRAAEPEPQGYLPGPGQDKQIPGKDGKLIDNPVQDLERRQRGTAGNVKIEVLGPPPTSGTRDAFVELAMEGGAKKNEDQAKLRGSKDEAEIKALMKNPGQRLQQERQEGPGSCAWHPRRRRYIEAGENDNLIVQKLEANPNAVGIFGFVPRPERRQDPGC